MRKMDGFWSKFKDSDLKNFFRKFRKIEILKNSKFRENRFRKIKFRKNKFRKTQNLFSLKKTPISLHFTTIFPLLITQKKF